MFARTFQLKALFDTGQCGWLYILKNSRIKENRNFCQRLEAFSDSCFDGKCLLLCKLIVALTTQGNKLLLRKL